MLPYNKKKKKKKEILQLSNKYRLEQTFLSAFHIKHYCNTATATTITLLSTGTILQ